jgi:MFS transporter, DHA1 family, multidrug resistance protein
MNKKQLFTLYTCYLIPYIVGNAIVSFLPLYAAQLGASSSFTGYYLAIAFASVAAGSISAGWFSQRYQNRKIFIIVGSIVSGLGLSLMGIAPNLLILTLITIVSWAAVGNLTAMILILTGLYTEEGTRGRTFGIITSALSLGAIIGGSIAGPIVERWDYRGLFILTGLLYIIPFFVAFLLEDDKVSKTKNENTQTIAPMNIVFWLILVGSVLIYTANFTGAMIRPFLMLDLNFDATAIASTIAISGVFNLPLPFIVGWLSDRFGRKWLLVATYFFAVFGLIILIYANQLWHFWTSRTVIGIIGASFALGSALLVDISEPEQVDTALARFATTPWIGGIIGYLMTGIAIEKIGMVNSLWLGTLIAAIAVFLTLGIRSKARVKVTI